jgi:hypothetical protein
MMPVSCKRHIVRLANGEYVRDYQYSQGYFDIDTTTDPLQARDIDEETFKTNFTVDFGQFCERADPSVVGSKRVELHVSYVVNDL